LALRDSVLNLLVAFAPGPRPIQTQLCVCLASLAIQMVAWKDVLATVGAALGSSAGDCVLEFLKILPEEVTEGRKINLSVCLCTPVHKYQVMLTFTKGRRVAFENQGVAGRQRGAGPAADDPVLPVVTYVFDIYVSSLELSWTQN
jgi:hypothetical protein